MNPAADPSTEQFGPYEVYERLGLGGMASVFRAKKRGPAGFERSVALKRMLSHLAEDPSFVESFVREAKVASMLVHPNIAQVYDFGRISGTYYIAMELVAGFDVRKLLRYANRANEAIPMPVILSILGELCDALDYAHTFRDEQGQPMHIVHRDISPSNMIVAHTGHLKVIDFGIAKANSRTLHTESGMVKGKLGYMSPEGAIGMPVGPVSDIFSMGVVAWELATAMPLFSARSDFETMRKIREEPVMPPSKFNPEVPAKLDSIILAALDREADSRLASARLFRKALDEVAADAKIQVNARSVADWIVRFAQPDDSWARGLGSGPRSAPTLPTGPIGAARTRSPSGRTLPLPPEPVTAVIGRARSATQLQRAQEDIALATEIWGEDARTVEGAGAPLPDFHNRLAEPPPAASGEIPMQAPAKLPGGTGTAPVPTVRSSKKPLAILALLAVVAGVLAAVLVWKKQSAPPAKAAVHFEIDPSGAKVMIAGNEVGHTSPLDTEVAAGVYAIKVELDGYKPYTSEITVQAGEHQTIHVALDKEEPEIAIETPPPPTPTPPPPVAQEDTPAPIDPFQSDKPTKHPAKPAKRETKHTKPEKQVAQAEPKTEPKTDPPKVDPPKVDPPKPPEPEKPVEAKPARTPLVAASAVAKVSGEVPVLHAHNAEGSGDVLAKLCIDDEGRVQSVKIVKSNPEIAGELQNALSSWRYKPYSKDGKVTPVCFPLSLRVVVKGS